MQPTLAHKTKHLVEHQLLPPDKFCPFCSSFDRVHVAVLQNDPDIFLLFCRNCHASSASRMPTQETLFEYYSSYYNESDRQVTIALPDKLANHIFRTSQYYVTKGAINILDFGGGNGEISVRLSQKFIAAGIEKVNISLIEYSPKIIQHDDNNIKINHYVNLSQIENQKYELVIASAIIEHIPSPVQDVTTMLNALQRRGIFYARTPYILPLMKICKLLGLKFDFTYPAHVHDLGPQFWNRIFITLPLKGEYKIIKSNPSIVSTSFRNNFARTLIAYLLKTPWYIFKNSYNLIGGWEVFLIKE
jgi:2-polyprenyl-3-methyl-5-hydroxy-6-metoxy-1,4-benzoquinol methylase